MSLLTHESRVTPEDARRHPYLYLPFEVPGGTTRIDVRLIHDEGNVVDLGVLDSRATGFPTEEGFRGWSGGARDRFFVATDDATPGYLPGPLPAGEWRVVLGLYRIAPAGCHVRVEIELDRAPRGALSRAPDHPRFGTTAGWYPGDLQSHTHHSDARGSVEDLVEAARARGLRFLAITDHNTVSHHRELARLSSSELFLLPGEEVTTAEGHANVWGASGWVDFRITAPEHVGLAVERAHALGGLFSINHPKPGGPDWRYPVPPGVDCVEAWQAPWPAGNDLSLDFFDRLLREGRKPVLVGGSDRHQPGWPDDEPPELQVGSPTTWLWLEELSVPACLAALRSGRVFVSESPEGPRLELTVAGTPMGGTAVAPRGGAPLAAVASVDSPTPLRLRLVGAEGALVESEVAAGPRRLRLEVDPRAAGNFVRAELLHPGTDRVAALSNPVFLSSA